MCSLVRGILVLGYVRLRIGEFGCLLWMFVLMIGIRAWWAMVEKGVQENYQYVHIELGDNKPSWYKEQINPLGTVPCVYEAGQRIIESLLVARYFEEQYPDQGTSLLPKSAAERALVHFISSRFDTSPFYAFIREQDTTKYKEHEQKCKDELKKFNNELHQFVPKTTGVYLCGEFSLADISLFPFIARFVVALKHYRDYDMNIEAYDRIHSAWEAVQTRPAFLATSCPSEFYVQVYDSYANPRKQTG